MYAIAFLLDQKLLKGRARVTPWLALWQCFTNKRLLNESAHEYLTFLCQVKSNNLGSREIMLAMSSVPL